MIGVYILFFVGMLLLGVSWTPAVLTASGAALTHIHTIITPPNMATGHYLRNNKQLHHLCRVSLNRYLSTSSPLSTPPGPVIAIRREESSVWERRAPLNPGHVQSLVKKGATVLVQPSTRRAYSMPEYEREGAILTDDIEDAHLIIGEGVIKTTVPKVLIFGI